MVFCSPMTTGSQVRSAWHETACVSSTDTSSSRRTGRKVRKSEHFWALFRADVHCCTKLWLTPRPEWYVANSCTRLSTIKGHSSSWVRLRAVGLLTPRHALLCAIKSTVDGGPQRCRRISQQTRGLRSKGFPKTCTGTGVRNVHRGKVFVGVKVTEAATATAPPAGSPWCGSRSQTEGNSRSGANKVWRHAGRSSRHRARGNP
jgi:hypothetical protein